MGKWLIEFCGAVLGTWYQVKALRWIWDIVASPIEACHGSELQASSDLSSSSRGSQQESEQGRLVQTQTVVPETL